MLKDRTFMSDLRGFERFIEERGKVKSFPSPSDDLIRKYESRLPGYMINVWQTYGFGSYAEGLFSFSSPEPFETILDTYFGKNHSYTVIGHSSFGDLLIWDNEKPSILSFNSAVGRGVRMASDGNINGFFKYGMDDDEFYKVHKFSLHKKAVKELGQLEEGQVFGFFPALSMGGKEKLENIKVVQIREYLAMLAEIAVEQNREIAARDA
jgi:hypothetical protein